MKDQCYCIITPAYNEADYIRSTVESVLCQTQLPHKWIIVDDGSSDKTAEIIKNFSKNHPLVQYVYRNKSPGQDYYVSNVYAIMEGWRLLQNISFDYLAILDADITLPNNYYEKILQAFDSDVSLGVASGVYENLIDGRLSKALNDRRSTPKAIQVFRREVFETIGGFLPLRHGGEDTIACVMARMSGWKAWSFPDIKVIHHRPTGTGRNSNILRVRFNQGVCEYSLASHPLFFVLKACRRMLLEKPFVLGGLLRICGYLWALIKQEKILIPQEVARFIRKEQLARLIAMNSISDEEKPL